MSAALLKLVVRAQYGADARREWTIYCERLEARGQRSEVTRTQAGFIAYSRTYTGARKAIVEIEASLSRLDEFIERLGLRERKLSQRFIDTRPRDERPMGRIRELIWNAARTSTTK